MPQNGEDQYSNRIDLKYLIAQYKTPQNGIG